MIRKKMEHSDNEHVSQRSVVFRLLKKWNAGMQIESEMVKKQ